MKRTDKIKYSLEIIIIIIPLRVGINELEF